MLEYLKTPPEGFESIIKTHFKLKARSIRAQLDKWLEEDDGKPLHADSMGCIHGSRYESTATAMAAQSIAASKPTDGNANVSADAAPTDAATTTANAAGTSKTNTAFAKDIEAIKLLLTELEKEE